MTAGSNRPVRSALRAARTGDPRELLIALRDRLAADIDAAAIDGDTKTPALIAVRLMKVNDQLAALGDVTKKEGSALDELAARRNRQTGT